MADRIKDKLTDGLKPLEIHVQDDSDRHIGHAGHDGAGESHFTVTVVSDAFAGRSRLERHRMVHTLLADAAFSRIHALSLRLFAPDDPR